MVGVSPKPIHTQTGARIGSQARKSAICAVGTLGAASVINKKPAPFRTPSKAHVYKSPNDTSRVGARKAPLVRAHMPAKSETGVLSARGCSRSNVTTQANEIGITTAIAAPNNVPRTQLSGMVRKIPHTTRPIDIDVALSIVSPRKTRPNRAVHSGPEAITKSTCATVVHVIAKMYAPKPIPRKKPAIQSDQRSCRSMYGVRAR